MILIISNRSDVTADFVVRDLAHRGVEFARLNTDEFPRHGLGRIMFPGGIRGASIHWTNRDRRLEWGNVTAVWYRRPVAPVPDETITDHGIRKFVVDECYDFLRGLWYSLDCFWVSHPDAIRRAEHKIVQLHAATKCGFKVPETLVSNAPDEVRSFVERLAGRVVVKPVYAGFLEAQGTPRFVYTTQPSEQDLSHLDDVRLSPCIFQERISKIADIRVTVVGDRLFATRIDADSLPPNVPDWRAADIARLVHTPYTLPTAIAASCIAVTKALGLKFGAIDLSLDQEGEHVFFEINANGQWAWIESATGARISEAIADLLLRC